MRAGEAAGIAFQWMDSETGTAGLRVVGILDGSIAAKNDGVRPEMQLIEINRNRITGFSQSKVMEAMRLAATQPRVLTLAQIALSSSRPSSTMPVHRSYTSKMSKGYPHDDSIESTEASYAPKFDVAGFGSFAEEGCPDINHTNHRPTPKMCPERSPFQPAIPSSSDGDNSSIGGSLTTCSTPMKGAPSVESRSTSPRRHPRLYGGSILALRFVGSRGDVTLFDRDHILGLTRRDIEFVLGGSSHLSKARRVNSQRSLGEMTLDWRNDPCSTPARRRRLINDACKVIVKSYTCASVFRFMELRRQEALATRIQAAGRMWSARHRYVEKLAERREKAALVAQLGWLSCIARRRTSILKEQRANVRRVDAENRRKRLRRETEKRRLYEEQREKAAQDRRDGEKRRRERASVAVIQRQYRVSCVGNDVSDCQNIDAYLKSNCNVAWRFYVHAGHDHTWQVRVISRSTVNEEFRKCSLLSIYVLPAAADAKTKIGTLPSSYV